jgi:hypothetical protein
LGAGCRWVSRLSGWASLFRAHIGRTCMKSRRPICCGQRGRRVYAREFISVAVTLVLAIVVVAVGAMVIAGLLDNPFQ